MLTVTDNASAHLAVLLDKAEAPKDMAVRFLLGESDLELKLDNVQPGDEVFDAEGRPVLVIDAQVSEVLSELTLDLEDSDEGPRLSLR